jgi:hypothetical protein
MIGYIRNNNRLRYLTWPFFVLILALLDPVVSLSQKQNEPQASRTEDQPIIICSTDLVLVQVEVSNEYRIAVSGLRLNDFAIFEDGILQEIQFFEDVDDSIRESVKYKIGYYPERRERERKNRRIRVEFVGRKREGLKVEYRPKRYSMVLKLEGRLTKACTGARAGRFS